MTPGGKGLNRFTSLAQSLVSLQLPEVQPLQALSRTSQKAVRHTSQYARSFTRHLTRIIHSTALPRSELEIALPFKPLLKRVGQVCTSLSRGTDDVVDGMKLKVYLLISRARTLDNMLGGVPGMKFALSASIEASGIPWTTVVIVGMVSLITVLGLGYRNYRYPRSPRDDGSQGNQVQVGYNEDDIPLEVLSCLSMDSITQQATVQPQTPRSVPPHLVLLQYIHPTSSIWPRAYLQAFSRAQSSQLSSLYNNSNNHPTINHKQNQNQSQVQTMTHIDTPPAANTRRKRDNTAKRSNGKIFLSRRAVRRDVDDGTVGLRAGVELGDGAAEWEGVEWID